MGQSLSDSQKALFSTDKPFSDESKKDFHPSRESPEDTESNQLGSTPNVAAFSAEEFTQSDVSEFKEDENV